MWKETTGRTTFGLVKNSPYSMFFQKSLLKLNENGKLYKIAKRWQSMRPNCNPLVRKGNPLSLEKLISIFMILLLGIICALIVMLIEQCKYFKADSNVNPPTKSVDFQRLKLVCEEIENCLNKKKNVAPGLLLLLEDTIKRIVD